MECRRCGRCCYYEVKNKLIKCRYLVIKADKTTECKVYLRRIGIPLTKGIYCGWRNQTTFDFKDCPYNTNKKIREV